jgi:hypothetical protein
MDLVSRVQAIILKPKEEWVKIKGESTTVAQLFSSYAVLLAAIPAIAQFIGYGLIGRRYPFIGWLRLGIGTSLLRAIFSYVFALVTVYLFAMIINALAPTFSSTPNMVNALKLSIYSMTPMWVAGILYLIPFLEFLVFIAGIYGLYILYLGFNTPLMDTPKEKVMGYLLVSIVVVVVLSVVLALILGAIFAVGGVYRPL